MYLMELFVVQLVMVQSKFTKVIFFLVRKNNIREIFFEDYKTTRQQDNKTTSGTLLLK